MTTSVRIFAAVFAAGLSGLAGAQEIYRCVDDEGNVTLQNMGRAKGCKALNVQPIVSVSAPSTASKAGRNAAEARPADFPRIDSGTQRARDDNRKRILEDELKAEESRLAPLRAEFNSGTPERRAEERTTAQYQERVQRMQQEIRRGESNVASLKREIALLQRQ
jgi:hypothetical protein